MIKEIITKIFHGALYGIGFTVVSFFAFLALDKSFDKRSFGRYNPNVLELLDHKYIGQDNELKFSGKIRNNDERNRGHLYMEVEFYHNGEFVYESRGIIDSTIEPGEEEDFILICMVKNYGSKADTIEYDSYKISINRALY